MHRTLCSAGPRGRPASDPISQMNKLRHMGFTTGQKSTRLDMRQEARGCILHYNSFPHAYNPGLTHLSYRMLHQRQGPSCRNPEEYLDRPAPASEGAGPIYQGLSGGQTRGGVSLGLLDTPVPPSAALPSTPHTQPAPSRARTLEAGKRWARLGQKWYRPNRSRRYYRGSRHHFI